MANYGIMRWGKIKTAGVANAEYHQRTELHKNCEHPELMDYNFTIKQFENETLRKTVKRLILEQQERTGRKVRKDATVVVDFVLTFSPEMIGKIDMSKWFQANKEWLEKEFGAKNILRLDMHFHESTPHLHAFVSPLDEKGNFNFRKYVNHISQLVQMQDRYAEAMEQFGLERGKTRWMQYDPSKPMKPTSEEVHHRPLRAWRTDLMKQIADMQDQLKKLPQITEEQNKALKELENLQRQVESKKSHKKKLESDLDYIQKRVSTLTGQKELLSHEIERLQQAQADEQERYLNLKAEAEKLKGEISEQREELAELVLENSNFQPETTEEYYGCREGDDLWDDER